MGFNGASTKTQINQSMNSMLMLHSSCQGIIEASINPVSSSWYPILLGELGDAENLVVDWRQNGYLYFQQDILNQSINCGQAFINAKADIDSKYDQLQKSYSQQLKDKIVNALQALSTPVQGLTKQISGYEDKLKIFERNMETVHAKMAKTVAQIQNEEASIQADITKINTLIGELKKQIIKDREVIAKAEKARTRGILETIFGFLLAPFTGGLSLILAGIGVSSIAEAESHIKDMETTIKKYGKEIIGSQGELSDDLKEIATLHGLLLSVSMALSDLGLIGKTLDDLRVNWAILEGELTNIIGEVTKADNSKDALVGQFWFESACNQWEEIVPHSQDLSGRSITTSHVQV